MSRLQCCNMRFFKNLIPFDSLTAPQLQVEIYTKWQESLISIEYRLIGNTKQLYLPHKQRPRRVIGLWESTCFEFFIKHPNGEDYVEFNFSPEGFWNCFYFPHKKAPLKAFEAYSTPDMKLINRNDGLSFYVTLTLEQLPIHLEQTAQISTPCVLDNRGKLSYWAFSHLDPFANFHNFESFLPISF